MVVSIMTTDFGSGGMGLADFPELQPLISGMNHSDWIWEVMCFVFATFGGRSPLSHAVSQLFTEVQNFISFLLKVSGGTVVNKKKRINTTNLSPSWEVEVQTSVIMECACVAWQECSPCVGYKWYEQLARCRSSYRPSGHLAIVVRTALAFGVGPPTPNCYINPWKPVYINAFVLY